MALLTAIVASWAVAWLGWPALPAVVLCALLGRLARDRPRAAALAVAAVGVAGCLVSYTRWPAPAAFLGWAALVWRAAEAGRGTADRSAFELETVAGAAALAVALLAGAAPPAAALPFAILALAGLHWSTDAWLGQAYGLARESGGTALRSALVGMTGAAGGLALLAAGAAALWLLARTVPPVVRILAALALWLAQLFAGLLPRARPVPPQPLPHRPPLPPPVLPAASLPPWAVWLLRFALALLAAAVVWLAWRALSRLFATRTERASGVRAAEDAAVVVRDAAPTAGTARRRVRRRDASLVRATFRRWLALAARHGAARRADETAREHAARVAAALPGAPELVDAYHRVRYGGLPDGAAAADALLAWESLRRSFPPAGDDIRESDDRA